MNKEQVYDERISPLITRILDICKEHGIAMLTTFSLPTDEKPGLQCSSMCPDEKGLNPDCQLRAYNALVATCIGKKPHEIQPNKETEG